MATSMTTSYPRTLTLILWILLTSLMPPVKGGYNVTVSHNDPMIEYGGLGWTPYIYDAVRAPSCVPTEYGRWSDEQDISVSFTFTGTAVYLLGFVDSSGAIMNVTIDGKFVNILNTSNANLVGCTIPWSKTNLKPRRHTVKFAKIVETRFRVIGFIYTKTEDETIRARKLNAIIGGTIGGALGIAVVVFLLWRLYKRKHGGQHGPSVWSARYGINKPLSRPQTAV